MAGTQLLVLVALVVAVMVDKTLLELLEPQTEAVVAVVVPQMARQVGQAAQALSSSRPINNEDKWKPKSIGCMELTPQCTC